LEKYFDPLFYMVKIILNVFLKLPINKGLVIVYVYQSWIQLSFNAILINIWSENTTILVQSSIVCLDILLNSIESKENSHKRYIDYVTILKNLGVKSKFIKMYIGVENLLDFT